MNRLRELHGVENFRNIPLLRDNKNVVIGGVINGNTRGKVFVNDPHSPSAALVWAQNEMVYLIGINEDFYSQVESLIIQDIKPAALQIGEDYFNLEILPDPSQVNMNRYFSNQLKIGKRVPFSFDKQLFIDKYSGTTVTVPIGYSLMEIDHTVLELDTKGQIAAEITKFWDSVETFFNKGIGYCVFFQHDVVAMCISVSFNGYEHEIGINTFDAAHRGKGLATAMAVRFIVTCLGREELPHWTTEDFRLDSIAIARKLAFKQLSSYSVYYLAFADFV